MSKFYLFDAKTKQFVEVPASECSWDGDKKYTIVSPFYDDYEVVVTPL